MFDIAPWSNHRNSDLNSHSGIQGASCQGPAHRIWGDFAWNNRREVRYHPPQALGSTHFGVEVLVPTPNGFLRFLEVNWLNHVLLEVESPMFFSSSDTWQSLTYTSFEQPSWPWKKKCGIWREVLKWIPINGSKVILKLLDGKTHQTWGYLNSGTHMNWKFLSKNWNLAT